MFKNILLFYTCGKTFIFFNLFYGFKLGNIVSNTICLNVIMDNIFNVLE